MTAREALEEYMKANKYEGLAGEECGCVLEGEGIAPCGESCLWDCELGHVAPCPKDGLCECDQDDPNATHVIPGTVEEAVAPPSPQGGGS